jgi:hypothetical protein
MPINKRKIEPKYRLTQSAGNESRNAVALSELDAINFKRWELTERRS